MGFHDFDQYERLLASAGSRRTDAAIDGRAESWTASALRPRVYMHLSPAATEDAIRLLDRRQSGLGLAENFGDILDTREVVDGNKWEGRV
jgi:hypothetical protein